MKTPITYYGGKQKMIPHILPLIPSHKIYVEPFFGGGAIFWAKERSQVEIVNDLNSEVINFYRVLKTQYKALNKEIQGTLHSRLTHDHARVVYDWPMLFSDVKRAWAFWALSSQSFSSSLTAGWGYDKTTGSIEKRMNSKKAAFTEDISKRIEHVQIECNDAITVITSRDSPDTFHYCDPPYFNSDKGHYKDYNLFEFDRLLKCLERIEGKFLLSSYSSDLLTEYTKRNGWHIQNHEKTVSVDGRRKGAKTKVEVLTANYPI